MNEVEDTHLCANLIADCYFRLLKPLKNQQHTDEFIIEFYDSLMDGLYDICEMQFSTLLDVPAKETVALTTLIVFQVAAALASNLASKTTFDAESKMIVHCR